MYWCRKRGPVILAADPVQDRSTGFELKCIWVYLIAMASVDPSQQRTATISIKIDTTHEFARDQNGLENLDVGVRALPLNRSLMKHSTVGCD